MDEELQAASKPTTQRDREYSGASSPESYREPAPPRSRKHGDYDDHRDRARLRYASSPYAGNILYIVHDIACA